MTHIRRSLLPPPPRAGNRLPGSECGKPDAADAQFTRAHEGILRRLADFGLIGSEILPHDCGMDDIPGWKGTAVCNNSFTNLDRTFRDRCALDLKAARSLERACYSRTHPK